MSRRERAVQIAAVGDDPRLVERCPDRLPVVESAEHHRRVFGEPAGDVAIEPSAAIIERRRQIPMKKRDERLNVRGAKRIDQAPVEVQSFLIHAPFAFRKNSAPRNAESIGIQSELAHERDVRFVTMVMIASDITVFIVRHQSGCVTEAVPDTRAGSIGERRSFNLIRRGGRSPKEVSGERVFVCHTRAAERFSSRWRVWRSLAFAKSTTTVT